MGKELANRRLRRIWKRELDEDSSIPRERSHYQKQNESWEISDYSFYTTWEEMLESLQRIYGDNLTDEIIAEEKKRWQKWYVHK